MKLMLDIQRLYLHLRGNNYRHSHLRRKVIAVLAYLLLSSLIFTSIIMLEIVVRLVGGGLLSFTILLSLILATAVSNHRNYRK